MSSLQPGPSISGASPDCGPPPHAKTFFSWMTETTAKSPFETERRLRAAKLGRPGPLSHLLCVFARWDAYVIAPRPGSCCGEKRRDARSSRSCHSPGLHTSFPGERTWAPSANDRATRVPAGDERSGPGLAYLVRHEADPRVMRTLRQLQPHLRPDDFARVGGSQTGAATPNEGPGGSELITCSDARRSTLHYRDPVPFC